MLVNNYHGNDKQIFSGHETFPLRYGWLKKVYDEVVSVKNLGENIKNIFNEPRLIANFGVGKNMVAAMRHWSNYASIIDKDGVTNFAKDFLAENGCDPWMESPLTLWLIHYNIVKNPNLITYHWFFNYYNGGTFDRKTLNYEILDLCNSEGWKPPSLITIKRDIECFIKMYVVKTFATNDFNNDAIEAPLAELSLIRSVNFRGLYSLNRGFKSNISTTLAYYLLLDFWQNYHKNEASISFEAIMYDPGSIGRVFLLDEHSLLLLVKNISDRFFDKISWSETAGIKKFTKKAATKLSQAKAEAYLALKKEIKNNEVK